GTVAGGSTRTVVCASLLASSGSTEFVVTLADTSWSPTAAKVSGTEMAISSPTHIVVSVVQLRRSPVSAHSGGTTPGVAPGGSRTSRWASRAGDGPVFRAVTVSVPSSPAVHGASAAMLTSRSLHGK